MRAGEPGCVPRLGVRGHAMLWQLQDWLAMNGSVAHVVRDIRRSFARVPSCNKPCVWLLLCVLPLL